MIVCKIGVAKGTATTGDAIIIPATQSAPDATNVNNPLPLATSTDPMLASSRASMLTAGGSKKPAMIAGTDEYLGTMTFISDADTAVATILPHADCEGTSAVSIPTCVSNLNDNAGGRVFDIVPKTNPTTTWLIGAAKLDAVLDFKQEAKVDWADAQSVMSICGPQASATIPSDLVMSATNSGSGAACTAAYMYTVGATDMHFTKSDTKYKDRAMRYCRWCNVGTGSGSNNQVYLKDFVPPTTSTRLLKGIVVLASDTAGKYNLATEAQTTATKQESVAIASGGCGKSG
jgi:hypothetical protein